MTNIQHHLHTRCIFRYRVMIWTGENFGRQMWLKACFVARWGNNNHSQFLLLPLRFSQHFPQKAKKKSFPKKRFSQQIYNVFRVLNLCAVLHFSPLLYLFFRVALLFFFATWWFHSLINHDYNLKLTSDVHRLGLSATHPAYYHLTLA